MTRTRYKVVNNNDLYLLTSAVIEWLPLFSNSQVVEIVLSAMQFMQDQKRIKIHGYVIMHNHLHMIASTEKLSKEFGEFKSFTAMQKRYGLSHKWIRLIKYGEKSHAKENNYIHICGSVSSQ